MSRRVLLFLLLFLAWFSNGWAQTPFYQGKTITIIAAAKAGDVYDLYPRLVAEFMPKFRAIPISSFRTLPGPRG